MKKTTLFGIKKTAGLLGISPGLLLKELKRGAIQAHRRGHLIKFKPQDIDRYETQQTINNYRPPLSSDGVQYIKTVPI